MRAQRTIQKTKTQAMKTQEMKTQEMKTCAHAPVIDNSIKRMGSGLSCISRGCI
jgi:hypothetical protein